MYDRLLCIAVYVLLGVGAIGCVLPVIPGVWLAYGALWVQYARDESIAPRLLVGGGVLALAATVLDNLIPAWGAKTFKGTKAGVTGCLVGTLAGALLFFPWGILVGPFAGAVVGELLAGQRLPLALRSGCGSFVGFVAGVLIKIAVCALFLRWALRAGV